MIQQEYRDSVHKQENALSAALKGGLVVGAIGAALAYQPWGRGVSRFLGRVHHTIKTTANENTKILEGRSSRYWTKTHYQQAYTNLKNAWANSAHAISLSDNRLTIDSPHSFAALIASVEEKKRNAHSIAKDIWRKDVLGKEAFQKIDSSQLSDNDKHQVRSFVEEVLKYGKNEAKTTDVARQHKLQGDAENLALDLAKKMRQRMLDVEDRNNTKNPDRQFIEKLTKGIAGIEEQAYSIKNLERFLGVAGKRRRGVGTADHLIHVGIRLATGSKQLTVGKVLEEAEAGRMQPTFFGTYHGTGDDSSEIITIMKRIAQDIRQKEGIEAYEKLMSLAVDPENMFVNPSGQIYSKFHSGEYWRDFLTATRNTLPGKLLKIGDLDNALRIPAVQMIRLEAHDPILRDKISKTHKDNKYHFRIGEDIYTMDLDSGISEMDEELSNGDLKFVSGRFGFFHKNIEAMRGMTKTKISDNPILRFLDVFQDREEYSGSVISDTISMFLGENKRRERFLGMMKMSSEAEARHISAMSELYHFDPNTDSWEDISEATKNYVREYMDNAQKVSLLFRQNTHKMSRHTLEELRQVKNMGHDYYLIAELLKENDDDRIMTELLDLTSAVRLKIDNRGDIQWLNKDLRELVQGILTNPDHTKNKIELVSEESGISYGSDSINIFRAPMGNETYYYMDSLKREMAKELLLRIGYDYTASGVSHINYNEINRVVDALHLSTHERDELEKLSQYAVFQDYSMLNRLESDVEQEYYRDKVLQIQRLDNLFRGKTNSRLTKEDIDIFRDVYTTTVEREVSILEGNLEPDIAGTEKLEDVVAINRSVNPLEVLWHAQKAINDPLDILKSINEGTIRLSGDASALEKDIQNIWGGLTANREDMSNANLYTFIPFWFTKRLSDELNKVGLGFSAETTTSAGNFAMSFLTKRALPIFAASTYLDWTDDTTREITGHGLWEGFTAGVANVDLGIRRGISALGMDDWLKEVKAVNPIWQYWGDHDEYQGYEERLDYYQNGYTPVRKAAWSVGHAA